jgi:hypothetical protein
MLRQFSEAHSVGKPMGFHINIGHSKVTSVEEVGKLCSKHNVLDLFLWLSMRFPGNHVEVASALQQKELLINLVDESLRASGSASNLTVSHNYQEHDLRIRNAYRRHLREIGMPLLEQGGEERGAEEEEEEEEEEQGSLKRSDWDERAFQTRRRRSGDGRRRQGRRAAAAA